ncbi:MAG: efflux transporter periplasmic adaptor subunit [Ahrensia sp.]|nr:efflux transporter periplasmic adaptor subunit [Ahrensia sp.]
MPDKTDIEAIAAKRGRRFPLTWVVVLAVAAAGAGYWYWQGSASDSGPVRYTTTAATKGDIVVTVAATGTVEPLNTVDISSELSGTVREVLADYNDEVAEGDVLARLDTDKLAANVEHSEASLTAARANLVQAEVTLEEQQAVYDRAQNLAERGISTEETLLQAKAAWQRAVAALDTAKANVKLAEADLKQNKADLAKADITSPINGIVLDRAVEAGQIVAASLSAPVLFTLAEDLKHMNLTVDIDEADIGQVKVGNSADFTVEAYQNLEFEATITQLRFAPETVDGVVTYKGILEVNNDRLLLRPGMTASAEITVKELNGVLTVPNAALRYAPPATTTADEEQNSSGLLGMLMPRRPSSGRSGATGAADAEGLRSIWVLKDNAPSEVKIRTGDSDGSRTQVLEGELAEGDPVITGSDAGR